MFFTNLKAGFVLFLEPVIQYCVDKGLHQDFFTILGLVLNVISGVLYGFGLFVEAGMLMIYGSSTDVIDGSIARRTNRSSAGGSILDSSLDRYSEIAVFLGIAVHYAVLGWYVTVGIVILALSGSLMVSYVRARAEGLGFDCKVGVMQRAERLIFLAAASIFGTFLGTPDAHMAAVMWALAFLTNLTALERIRFVRREAEIQEGQQ